LGVVGVVGVVPIAHFLVIKSIKNNNANNNAKPTPTIWGKLILSLYWICGGNVIVLVNRMVSAFTTVLILITS
jgi:hypothetical protein